MFENIAIQLLFISCSFAAFVPARIETYLRHEQFRCKPSTISGYKTCLGDFCYWLEQSKQKVTGLTKSKLKGYFVYLENKNLVPYSKVNYLLSVKKYLLWEVECGTLKEDVLSVLDTRELPKVPEYLPRPLSTENDYLLQDMLNRSSSPYAPIFLLLRHTGLRISELINLPVHCVVTTAKEESYLKVPLGKMNNERLVPLSKASLDLIGKIKSSLPLKPNRLSTDRLIGISGKISSVYYILNLNFKNIVGDMTDQGKPITFHRLRHTYATSLLSAGVGIASLMKLLGHRRIDMTLRYAKVTPTLLRNEYLKAIKILESRSLVANTASSNQSLYEMHPAEIITMLIAFINKTQDLNMTRQRNITRRLNRLQLDLANMSFSQKFKLHLNYDKSVTL